jgi:hypothetical protein
MLGRRIVLVLAFAALVGGGAGAAFAAIDPVNKYAWMEAELEGVALPIDCDGPATWMIVAVPSGFALLVGGVGAWMTGGRRSRAVALILVGTSLCLLFSALPRVRSEVRRNSAEPSCN